MAVPLPISQPIEVRSAAVAVASGAAPSVSAPVLARTPPPAMQPLRADELLLRAAARKDEGDLDDAIGLLRQAYDNIRQARAMFPVDTFLRLPAYLHHAGKNGEAWQEYNRLLLLGYPNQPHDVALLALDRAKIFDRMSQFLEHTDQQQLAAVFGVFSMVCKGINLYREDRRMELKSWFNRKACAQFVSELKKYTGNLGKLQGVQYAVVGELSEYPSVDFDLLAKRIDVTLTT